MRPARISLLLLTAILVTGCGGEAELEVSEDVTAILAALDETKRDSFMGARRQQQQALASTSDLVGRVGSASTEEIEQAMKVLNEALLRARWEITSLRNTGPDGRTLIDALRQGNIAVVKVYKTLQEQHPDASPEMMAPAVPES